jgi:hypothetical protein
MGFVVCIGSRSYNIDCSLTNECSYKGRSLQQHSDSTAVDCSEHSLSYWRIKHNLLRLRMELRQLN